ncbi:hypothetical protein LZC95_29400 [Pendulispora brunnea]|uniref:Uncharacterized protein n=1 Tax=Pendulispora brunnea TaxID=2905690 RepID=A0ABZ2K0K6_9BACT
MADEAYEGRKARVHNESKKQVLHVFTFVACLVGMGVVLQLWLLGDALEALLAGKGDLLIPAAGASLMLFAVHAGLLAFVHRLDQRTTHV